MQYYQIFSYSQSFMLKIFSVMSYLQQKIKMNFHTGHSPFLFYPYFPYSYPQMHYYQYQAPYFQNYEEPPLREEKHTENSSKLSQSQVSNNVPELKPQIVQEKKIISSTSNRSKNRKNEGDQEYQERKQTPQRNTLSNTIKYFLRFVTLKSNIVRPQLRKILDRLGFQYDAKQFLKAFEQQFAGKMNYISKDCIENIWLERPNSFSRISGERKNHFCIIFRELFSLYFDDIIYEERLSDSKRRKSFETQKKKFIKLFFKDLENKRKKKNEASDK